MAEQVIFGKTNKRINDMNPSFTEVITTNVLLKGPCSIVAPSFLVKQNYATLRECNYCSYAGFYYYITDVKSVRNKHCLVHCSRDPLSSFSDQIKNVYGYFSYGDAGHWNPNIDDTRMQPDLLNLELETKSIALFGNQFLFDVNGTIILKTFAMGGLTNSSVKTYALTFDQFIGLAFDLNNHISSELDALTNIEQILRKIGSVIFGGDLKDNILDCYWTPTRYARIEAITMVPLVIGAYRSSASNFKLISDIDLPFRTTTDASSILTQTLFSQYPFLRDTRFTSLQLKHPCGVVEINAEELRNDPTLNIKLTYNYLTGDYIVTAFGSKDDYDRAKIYGQGSGTMRMDLLGYLTSKGTTATSFAGNMAKMAGKLVAAKAIKAGTKTTITTTATTSNVSAEGDKLVKGAVLNGQSYQSETNTLETTNNTSTGIYGAFLNSSPQISMVNCELNNPGMMCLYNDLTDPQATKFYIVCTSSYPKLIKDNQYIAFCMQYGYPVNTYFKIGDAPNYSYLQGEGVSAYIYGATSDETCTINSMINSGIYVY